MPTRQVDQEVAVTFQYPVLFTDHLFSPDNPVLADLFGEVATHQPARLLCVVDDGVAAAHPELANRVTTYIEGHLPGVQLMCPPVVLPGGEQAKNGREVVDTVHEHIDRHGIDRHGFVMVVGGGALLDAAGYAAATAHRGIRLVRVPTTVLSQNDSGVGVKNGVNRFGKKNFVGTFAPPWAVLNDYQFLTTLEDRDWLGGVSEGVKVALLKDPAFFAYIEEQAAALVRREMAPMREVVYRCAELHLEHIATSGDPFEMGTSRPLDFGHWAAHKLEQLTGYALRHGEAVAIGLALDATYSYRQGLLQETAWRRVMDAFAALNLPVYHPLLETHLETPNDPRSVLAGIEEFREHLGGELTIMLLADIGRGIEVNHIDRQLLIESIATLASAAPNQPLASYEHEQA